MEIMLAFFTAFTANIVGLFIHNSVSFLLNPFQYILVGFEYLIERGDGKPCQHDTVSVNPHSLFI